MAGDCSARCGTSGFMPVAQPRCGGEQGYQVCRCPGAQGGGCTEEHMALPLTCR